MQRYSNLTVWRRSHALVLQVYRLTKSLPRSEQFGITSQLQRAAVSVPSNIAEGAKRAGRREYAHFLNVAEASLAETDYLLLLARDLGFAESSSVETLRTEADEILRMLSSLRKKVEKSA
jgi:four helix bundle protein